MVGEKATERKVGQCGGWSGDKSVREECLENSFSNNRFRGFFSCPQTQTCKSFLSDWLAVVVGGLLQGVGGRLWVFFLPCSWHSGPGNLS